MALDGGEEARERRERAALAAADAREARAGAVALGVALAAAVALLGTLLALSGLPGLPSGRSALIHREVRPFSGAYPTAARHPRPREGVHFEAGAALHEEGRVLAPRGRPHRVVELTDFFCAHCQRGHADAMHAVLTRYLPTGRVRIESHPVAFLEGESMHAAHAALCAQEQHKYWEMRELLFQADLSHPHATDGDPDTRVFTERYLRRLARAAHLDMRAFTACTRNATHRQEVLELGGVARAMGVKGTPHYVLDDRWHIEGVPSVAQLEAVLGPMPADGEDDLAQAEADAEREDAAMDAAETRAAAAAAVASDVLGRAVGAEAMANRRAWEEFQRGKFEDIWWQGEG